MNFLKKIADLFSNKKQKSIPLLIIKKETDDANVKEYRSIEEAIADLETDPHVPMDKIIKLKESIKKIKYKTSIKIKDGEIIA